MGVLLGPIAAGRRVRLVKTVEMQMKALLMMAFMFLTARGGEAKTKNGMGVATGPNGTTCVKGKNNQGCKKE